MKKQPSEHISDTEAEGEAGAAAASEAQAAAPEAQSTLTAAATSTTAVPEAPAAAAASATAEAPTAEAPTAEAVGAGFMEAFVQRYPLSVLQELLRDHSANRNIIWADNEYEALGAGYAGDDEITIDKITGLASGVIKPRIAKAAEKQSQRTKSRAEVFTPSWLCNQMNNDIDEVWFGRRDVFNVESVTADKEVADKTIKTGEAIHTWYATTCPIAFPKTKGHGWQAYVKSKRLEITCGEAPFICSRYDTVTGTPLPVKERIGFLDRKLRVVSENTKTRPTWVKWALAALQASYGFEYQGDNLLIARINVFETYMEHARARWHKEPTEEEQQQVALVISWNVWQMNGFTAAVPTNKMDAVVESPLGEQSVLFEEQKPVQTQIDFGWEEEEQEEEQPKEKVALCLLRDWETDERYEYAALKRKACLMGKKFYAVIGNPPYQGECDDNGRKPPIYHYFMDEAYEVSEKAELITPARFLFGAGQTPKAWNHKMLSDKHLKVLSYIEVADSFFPNTEIKGGVVITLRDASKMYEPIGTFTSYSELNAIVKKTVRYPDVKFVSEIVAPRGNYRTTPLFFEDFPQAVSILGKGTGNMIASNFFEKVPECAGNGPSPEMLKFLCRIENRRAYRYINQKYVLDNEFIHSFNVGFPKSNGTGRFGEVLTIPEILGKSECATDTYISIGKFASEIEAQNFVTYIKTKFMRAMLGVKKVTQDNSKNVWQYVPLQDFTSMSDIDWSQSISDIDQQLYKKYGLDENEINFIETHVKEMN